jgi:sugar transferase (PEP-CTERM/EpsH1 system associated)
MDDLLFLCHRIPFPPDKGDKIRSFHVLDHLATRYRVHLGCFYDDPLDARYVGELELRCASLLCLRLHPSRARIKSMTALLSGKPLTQAYYRDGRLEDWVTQTMRRHRPGAAYVFGSVMAPYALPYAGIQRVLDMVDFDSEKWRAYSETRSWPLSWLYAREQRRLFELERKAAAACDWTLLVSRAEAELFRRAVPEVADRILEVSNGVDTGYFDPSLSYPNPFAAGTRPVVFTGAMDYWPNIQAVEWFAANVMPAMARQQAGIEFWIVGANPSRAVRRLSDTAMIKVTGRVEDVRPYLAGASAVVAPLQIARGIQNKVLEAMAMARPVIATPQAAEGIVRDGDTELIVRAGAPDFAQGLLAAFGETGASIGRQARALVETRFQWRDRLRTLDALLANAPSPARRVDLALSSSAAEQG